MRLYPSCHPGPIPQRRDRTHYSGPSDCRQLTALDRHFDDALDGEEVWPAGQPGSGPTGTDTPPRDRM